MTSAVENTVCICGHWYEEHTDQPEGMICAGCDAAGFDEETIVHAFQHDPEETPRRLAESADDFAGEPLTQRPDVKADLYKVVSQCPKCGAYPDEYHDQAAHERYDEKHAND